MTEKPDRQNSFERLTESRMPQSLGMRLPFWFSASNYYVLSIAVAIAFFFLVWGFFSGTGGEIAWITAGVTSSLVLVGAVVLRGILFQRMKQRFLLERSRIDTNLRNIYRSQNRRNSNKLTIEKNNLILQEIERKSKSARAFEKLPERHLEVFEMCDEYLRRNESELNSVGVGSPRLPVLRKSREKVEKFHKYHLLAWASLESRLLIQNAKSQPSIVEKLARSQKALSVLDSAVQFYPDEAVLNDSINAVKDFIVTVKVNHWTEQAERAANRGNYKRAINHYRDALFFLARENERTPERELIAEKINSEIQKLTEIKSE